jgi:Arc/MetJ-type ribon-helix-helix transcriptional regulator
MADGDKMVNIAVSPELLEQIETFRFENRFAKRVEAIRWLIQAALDRDLRPNKAVRPDPKPRRRLRSTSG